MKVFFLPINKWPLMSDHAKGTYFWDVDGNKYLDLMCAYGPNVLGYCDEDVDATAIKQTPHRQLHHISLIQNG